MLRELCLANIKVLSCNHSGPYFISKYNDQGYSYCLILLDFAGSKHRLQTSASNKFLCGRISSPELVISSRVTFTVHKLKTISDISSLVLFTV